MDVILMRIIIYTLSILFVVSIVGQAILWVQDKISLRNYRRTL